jgi:hypothetical protein
MKYRPQRGSLADSMAACVELDATYDALASYLGTNPEALEVKHYMFDAHSGWDLYIVTIGSEGVGFTDEEVTE